MSKVNASGTALLYSTFVSGTEAYSTVDDEANAIGIDGSGNAYVAGSANTLDFPVSPGAFETSNLSELVSGNKSSFLVKIDPTATKVLYGTYLAGTGDGSGFGCDCTNGLAVGPSGNVYLTGFSDSSDFPSTLAAFQSVNPSAAYATFVTEFNGNELTSLPATTTTVASDAVSQVYGSQYNSLQPCSPAGGTHLREPLASVLPDWGRRTPFRAKWGDGSTRW